MRCHAKTRHGTRCKNAGWGGWPMCKKHLEIAGAEILAVKYGENARYFAVIDNTEDDDECLEDYHEHED